MNENTKKIIKSTAPIIKEHGEEITATMYKFLFLNHPEAKDLFKNAQEDQYKKLANMVYAYAENIDKLDLLANGINKVAQIHVNTNIQAKHYPWVGEALLLAIQEVLKDGATPEVLDAWREAFFFLADVFINAEKEIRQKQISN